MSNASKENNEEITVFQHPVIAYCNWSFDKKHHISENELENALHRFDKKCIPYYVRLFDEAPADLLLDFTETHSITKKEMKLIYRATRFNIRRSISDSFLI